MAHLFENGSRCDLEVRGVSQAFGKTSPDASAPSAAHLGQHTRATATVKGAIEQFAKLGAGNGHADVGDKAEAHTSEEELGVTTPRKEGAH